MSGEPRRRVLTERTSSHAMNSTPAFDLLIGKVMEIDNRLTRIEASGR
jgi:hypothetical protein